MNKKDVCRLVGGTVAGMSVATAAAGGVIVKEKCFRVHPWQPAPGHIPSKNEIYMDYLRRKGIERAKSQNMEHLEIISRDGLRLVGEYIHNTDVKRGKGEPVKVVILTHGYGGTGWNDLMIFADFYLKEGFDILAIEQRSHARSEGTRITFGSRESDDMIIWISRVIEIAGTDCKILLHGWSMGAATVYLTAAKGLPSQVKGVVFDCGYTAIEATMFQNAKDSTPIPPAYLWYLLQFMKPIALIACRFRMKDAAPLFAAGRMHLPIFFVHGTADTTVPFWMGRKLYKASKATPYRRMLVVRDAEHTHAYAGNKSGYEAGIRSLIDYCM